MKYPEGGKGLKLREALADIAGKIKIGASGGTNFFYCGTPLDLVEHEEEYEKQMIDHAKELAEQSEKALRMLEERDLSPQAFVKVFPDGDEKEYIRFIGRWLKSRRSTERTLKERRDYVKDWVALLNRKVVDLRDTTAYDEGAKIIIVEGNELGAYWTLDEVRKPLAFRG